MGIGERHCDCLAFVTLGLGDASFRRHPASAMLALGVSSPRRRLMLTLTPTLTLTLTLSTPGYETVQSPIARSSHSCRVLRSSSLTLLSSSFLACEATNASCLVQPRSPVASSSCPSLASWTQHLHLLTARLNWTASSSSFLSKLSNSKKLQTNGENSRNRLR